MVKAGKLRRPSLHVNVPLICAVIATTRVRKLNSVAASCFRLSWGESDPPASRLGSGGVATVTAVSFFPIFFLNVACRPPTLPLPSPPPPIPSLPPLAQLSQVFIWDKASRRHRRLNAGVVVPRRSSFCNRIPPIKTGNTGVCHQGASPDTTRPEIRESSSQGGQMESLRSWCFCKSCLVSVGNGVSIATRLPSNSPCCYHCLPTSTEMQPVFLSYIVFEFPTECLDYGRARSAGPGGDALLCVSCVLIRSKSDLQPNVSPQPGFNVAADKILIFLVTYTLTCECFIHAFPCRENATPHQVPKISSNLGASRRPFPGVAVCDKLTFSSSSHSTNQPVERTLNVILESVCVCHTTSLLPQSPVR